MTTKSNTVAVFPILAALYELVKHGKVDNFKEILGFSENQKYLLDLFPKMLDIKLDPQQLKTKISENVDELNSFLKENGFDIQLSKPMDLGIVAILDLIGQWIEKGIETNITYDNQSYPATLIKSGVSSLHSYGNLKLIKIVTDNGLAVYIEPDADEQSGLDLFKRISKITEGLAIPEHKCHVVVPMVSLNMQPDISWVQGIKAREFTVTQAMQQNKLTLNCDGIHAESAVALGLRKGISFDKVEEIIIDQPFNLWIGIDNDSMHNMFPLFGAYLAPDSWKK